VSKLGADTSALAPKAVAKRCGLGSPAALRRVFIRQLGVSPSQYRDKFRRRAGHGGRQASPALPALIQVKPARRSSA
jgi:methylphosphotriester-DNA--protein-cysteine methyltransferase